jgi:hypothetical protein
LQLGLAFQLLVFSFRLTLTRIQLFFLLLQEQQLVFLVQLLVFELLVKLQIYPFLLLKQQLLLQPRLLREQLLQLI